MSQGFLFGAPRGAPSRNRRDIATSTFPSVAIAAFAPEVINETESEMETLRMFVRYEIGFVLAALIAVVGFQLLTGKIETRGLLREKTKNGLGGVSPARVQLLLLTVGFAFHFLSQVVSSVTNAVPYKPLSFPTVSTQWLLILFGSHSIYHGAKGYSMFGSQPKAK